MAKIPQTIEEELLLVKSKDGLIKPIDALMQSKKHPDWPVGQQLEWNNNKAADEYRLWQIRKLIAIYISYEDDGSRRMVSLSIDRTNPGGGYRDIDDVIRTRSLYDIMFNDALNEIDRLRIKYERIKELKPVWAAAAEAARRKSGDGKKVA